MPKPTSCGIDAETLTRLSGVYRQRWGIGLSACRPDGGFAMGLRRNAPAALWRLAVEESLRWGEPTIHAGPRGSLVWAVPLMRNSLLLGGLIAGVPERRLAGFAVAAACTHLRELAEEANLTNAALLAGRRGEADRERQRAEAIHAYKTVEERSLHGAFLLDEPMLIAAVRRGDRGEARGILNRLLVEMIQRADGQLDIVKSFFMELVVTLCRSAVEAGGSPVELLGANYAGIVELASLDSDEAIAPWLHQTLERILDSIQRNRKAPHPALLPAVLRHMSQHCCRDIPRDEVARVFGLSKSHFSRLFSRHMGQTFSQVLNQMRIDKAAELLATTDRDIKAIAQDTGFPDQSYLTKVFRAIKHVTPAQYRREHAGKV